jgi:type IV pilus biogenesis protein CpaD/CtpE
MMTLPRRGSRAVASSLVAGMLFFMAGCASRTPEPTPRILVTGSPCPHWWEYPADPHDNSDSPFLGCIAAVNLRAMVANPADLRRGRSLGPADGDRESQAIETYQQGKIKPLAGSGSSSMSSSGGGAQ